MQNDNLKTTVEFCSKWFKENNIDIPTTAREWSKGRSGKNIPPGCTYATLRRKGIMVGDLLEALRPDYLNRVSKDNIPTDKLLEDVGLKYLSREGKETIKFICESCKEEKSTLLSTIKRWKSKGQKHCSDCRSASGKTKSIEYYQQFLAEEFKVLDLIGKDLLIQHTTCGTNFYRGRGYIAGAQRSHSDLVCCPSCTPSSNFIFNRQDGFLSLIEKEVIEHLDTKFPHIKYQREVLYREFLNTDRDFRLDLWLPDFSIGIEITSPSNKLPSYVARLEEKLDLAKSQGVPIYVIRSKKQLEDIVRTLLKGRERV